MTWYRENVPTHRHLQSTSSVSSQCAVPELVLRRTVLAGKSGCLFFFCFFCGGSMFR